MVTPLQAFATYLRSLLQHPAEGVVHVGSKNFRADDATALQIVVEGPEPEKMIAEGESYDSELEEVTYRQQWKKPIQINFYGDLAYQEVIKFVGVYKSRASTDLQEKLQLCVKHVSQITDVKELASDTEGFTDADGSTDADGASIEQDSEHYQIELNVIHTTSITIPQLRIDAAPIELENKG